MHGCAAWRLHYLLTYRSRLLVAFCRLMHVVHLLLALVRVAHPLNHGRALLDGT